MKRIFNILIVLVGLNGVAFGQLQLQCPQSCLPVTACGQCWASVEAAQNAGCTSAARNVDLVNEVAEVSLETAESVIYPNPSFDGYFTLQNAAGFSGNLTVVDAAGKFMMSYDVRGDQTFTFRDLCQEVCSS